MQHTHFYEKPIAFCSTIVNIESNLANYLYYGHCELFTILLFIILFYLQRNQLFYTRCTLSILEKKLHLVNLFVANRINTTIMILNFLVLYVAN